MKPLVFAMLAAASLSAASATTPKFGIPEMATYVVLGGEKTGYDICTPPDLPAAAKSNGTAVVLVTVRPGGGIDHVELEGGAKPDAITAPMLDSARSCILPGTGKRRVVKVQYWWQVE